jgi:hypothetical protein
MADQLFEPAMQSNGWFHLLIGGLVGTGPGAGMASMFVFTAVCGGLLGFIGLLLPSIRQLDEQGSVDPRLKLLLDPPLAPSD